MIDEIIINILNYILSSFGCGVVITTIIFILILSNPDKIEKLMALLYRMFSWIHKKLEYGNIATNIQVAINNVSDKVNRDCPDVLPYAMKIEWAKTVQDTETFLRNGEIIVTMDYSRSYDRNLVVSTLAYLEKGLLPIARSYVDKTLMKATDFTVAKEIFTSSWKGLPTNYFFQNYLEPEMEKDSQLRHDCTILDNLQKVGLLSKIFLRQVHYFGNKAYPSIPDLITKKESLDFALFLENIATRKSGEDTNLTFVRSRIRTSILLIAKAETKMWGTEAYSRRVKINLDRGIEHMYICARKANNISLAKQVANEEEKASRLKILATYNFMQTIGEKEYSAICIVCAMNLLAALRIKIDSSSALYRLLEEHVKELRDGQLEVVAMATQPGIKSKIAVRSLVDDLNPVHCFVEQSRLNAMESALGGERLEFIKWNNEPRSLIIDSLAPLDPKKVIEIEIDTKRRQAIIKVDGWEAKRKALGRGNQNVNCAMELTGWQIAVEEVPKEKEEQGQQ
ncbi:MAG: hypothetical protein KJ706_01935 [Candidatus Omnitrophica bacterium]|nr:hypothetical protein [Candidatus Omnitrophota bacterium]